MQLLTATVEPTSLRKPDLNGWVEHLLAAIRNEKWFSAQLMAAIIRSECGARETARLERCR